MSAFWFQQFAEITRPVETHFPLTTARVYKALSARNPLSSSRVQILTNVQSLGLLTCVDSTQFVTTQLEATIVRVQRGSSFITRPCHALTSMNAAPVLPIVTVMPTA